MFPLKCEAWGDPALGALLGFATWGALRLAGDLAIGVRAWVELVRARRGMRRLAAERGGGQR